MSNLTRRSVFVCIILLLGLPGFAQCPFADLTADCFVDLVDFAVIADNWMVEADMSSLFDLAGHWLTGVSGPQGMMFVTIPGGTFQMGDSFYEGLTDERPVHTVTISTFKMSKYEVTNAQYAEYLNGANTNGTIKVAGGIVYAMSDESNNYPYFDTHGYDPDSQIGYSGGVFSVKTKGNRGMSNDPVVEVSWYGATAFCDYYGYRLPTEAEWEYAARGGEHNPYYRFPWGDTISHNQANYDSIASRSYDISSTNGYHPSFDDGIWPYTAPVGSLMPNGYDLYNMAGNVEEWCNDWYGSVYYTNSPQYNPQGPVNRSKRVIRGGGWYYHAYYCRIAYRHKNLPISRYSDIGFRPILGL